MYVRKVWMYDYIEAQHKSTCKESLHDCVKPLTFRARRHHWLTPNLYRQCCLCMFLESPPGTSTSTFHENQDPLITFAMKRYEKPLGNTFLGLWAAFFRHVNKSTYCHEHESGPPPAKRMTPVFHWKSPQRSVAASTNRFLRKGNK